MRFTISCDFKFIKIPNRNKAVCQAPVRSRTGFQKVCQILSSNRMNFRKRIQSCIIISVFILISYREFKLFCFFPVFVFYGEYHLRIVQSIFCIIGTIVFKILIPDDIGHIILDHADQIQVCKLAFSCLILHRTLVISCHDKDIRIFCLVHIKLCHRFRVYLREVRIRCKILQFTCEIRVKSSFCHINLIRFLFCLEVQFMRGCIFISDI